MPTPPARSSNSRTTSARVITDICVRLDGLPLAIELAAARTRAFPLQQISVRLNDRFRLLTGGSRTALRTPADAARGGRLELRAALRRRAASLRAPVGVPRWLRSGHGGGHLRGRDHRRGRPRRSSARTRRQVTPGRGADGRRAAVRPAPDTRRVRHGATQRTGRRRTHPRRDGEALRRAVREERVRVFGRRAARRGSRRSTGSTTISGLHSSGRSRTTTRRPQ